MLNLLLSDLIVPEVGPKMSMSNIFNYAPKSKADVFVKICWVFSLTVQLKLKCQRPWSCFPLLGSVIVQRMLCLTEEPYLVIPLLQRVTHRRIAYVAASKSTYFAVGVVPQKGSRNVVNTFPLAWFMYLIQSKEADNVEFPQRLCITV